MQTTTIASTSPATAAARLAALRARTAAATTPAPVEDKPDAALRYHTFGITR